MNILEIIGQRLRQARETVGYTPEEVSQKLGISTEELLLFESGRKSQPLSVLRKLAKLYGVFVGYFYGVEKPEGTAFTLLLDKAKELSLPPETVSQVQRFIFLCWEIVKLRQKLGIPKPEIPQVDSKENLGELLEDMGIPVIRLPLGRGLASAMVCDEDFGAFILVNSDCPDPNRLIAHEYAYILQGEKVHLNAKDCPKATLQSKPPMSKVLWELVLTAVKHELISTSYAADVLEISPMEIEEFL
ncbi:MAG: helix-turn-helix domain-containing protein [Thermocrinis sp.]|jgi:transcriptional regulator with XRE-family HTH domain|uniref:helix-turn-helix domain-containing protein n=1 Tax=Thermocrinis sp. TaxID=2024383 RepID=UPI003C03CD49